MSYDPSHRRPPRQERWPNATPPEGWPSYRDGEQADGRPLADRRGVYPAIAGYLGQNGNQRDPGGYGDFGGYRSAVATDDFPAAGNGYAGDGNGYLDGGQARGRHAGGGYGSTWAADDFDTTGGHAATSGYASTGRYASTGGYGTVTEELPGTSGGYDWNAGGYPDGANGYGWYTDGKGWSANGYAEAADGYAEAADGYAEAADDFADPGGYRARDRYAEPAYSDPMLVAPDAGVRPDTWAADQDSRREAARRGLAVSGATGFLAVAVAIGVSTLATAILRSQVAPATAVTGVFIDRMPAALRNLVAQHFGAHGRDVLLLGMYGVIALLAITAGVLARRAAALGVAGLAAFSLLAAFVTVTRPGGRVADVIPAVIGGLAGVMALAWLVRASAPAIPLRYARGARRRA